MAIVPIKIYGQKVLRQKADPVTELTDEIKRLIADMRDSLYYHQGVGLAANQVGVPRRVILGNDGKLIRVFINPRIVRAEGTVTAEEGCLSFPEIYVDIARPAALTLEYLDENGEARRLEAEKLLARIIQHEIDHLDGILICDRTSFLSRRMIAGKLRKLEKRVRESY